MQFKRKPDAFNLHSFITRMMGDEDLAHEVATQFYDDLFWMLTDLELHVGTDDYESIRKQAHRIKGSAANVGGDALADAASKLELATRSGDSSIVASLAADTVTQAALLRTELRLWLASSRRLY